MTSQTYTQTYAATSSGALNFSAVTVSETDTVPGTDFSYLSPFVAASTAPAEQSGAITVAPTFTGLTWTSFAAGSFAPGDAATVNISYTVSSNVASQAISAFQQAITADYNPVPGASLLQAVETLTSNGVVVGRSTVNLATPNATGPTSAGDIALTGSYSSLQVNVALTFSVASTATAAAGINFSYLDQGFLTSSVTTTSISGSTWLDLNGDGVYQGGEVAQSGVTVELLNAAGTTVLATTTTDASGNYTFQNLAPGSYEVEFLKPTGLGFTAQTAGSAGLPGSAANATTGITAPITVAAGTPATNVDAGLVIVSGGGGGGVGAFSTHVYLDGNADGAQGAGEANLAGVTVALLNSTGGATGQTAVTDANGNVTFAGLAPGSYEVAVTKPTGDVVAQSTNIGTPVSVTAGSTATAVEGVYAPAAFTTHVYLDGNADGTQGAGESNLAGVTVALLNATGGATGKTAVTDANGNVSFAGLVPGTYEVAVTTPTGDVVKQATNVLTPITLSSGQTAAAVEGVYAPAAFTTHVYLDGNADGAQSAGESNLAGVTVALLNATGGATGKTAVTDANGNVSFAGLVPGTYEVAVTTPTGDVVKQATNVLTPITLTSGQTAAAVEGVYAPAAFTTHVFFDTNANKVQDAGDSNLAGVTVALLNGTGGATGQTAVTDANGNVTFANLTPGSYEVAVTTPTGDTVTTTTNVQTVTTLASGQTGTAVEGVTAPTGTATFTTHVYYDTNKDGVQGSGETNMAGVTVQLLNGLGKPTGQTAVTNAQGNVSFAGLTAGTYEVAVTTPTGDVVTKAVNVGTPNALAAGGSATAIEGLVAKGASITVDKSASVTAVKAGSCVTYTYKVTNTGTQALDNIKVVDNHGTALNPINITPSAVTNNGQCSIANVGDTNNNGLLDVGETWTYQATITENGTILGTNSCSAATTITGCNTHGGESLWLNSVLHNYSNSDGTCYSFRGLTANVTCADGSKHSYAVADSDVTFSKSCTSATTNWDSGRNCWVTTVPAGSNLGNVFMSGAAINIASGCNMQGATVTMSVAACTGSAGASTPTWQIGASAYDNMNTSCGDASADYSKIGVKSCDNQSSGYGGCSTDKAGTAGNCENNYVAAGWQPCYGWQYSWSCGWNWACTGYSYTSGSGNCGTSGSSGYSTSCSINLGQGTDQSVIDNVTVTAQTYCASATNNYCSGTQYDCSGNQYVSGCYGANNNACSYSTNNCAASYSCATTYCGNSASSYTNTYSGAQCGTVGNNTVCPSGDNSGLVWDYSNACWTQPTATNVNTNTGCGTVNGCTVTTVTGTDMANVQVLNTSSIQLNGTAPTAELSSAFGAAAKLEFVYNASNTVSVAGLQTGIAQANGSNTSSMAFIEVSNSSNAFNSAAKQYFLGSVGNGGKFIADATTSIGNVAIANGQFSTASGQDLYIYVFADQNAYNAHAAALQTIVYDTTGQNGGMHIGDQIGSVKLAGYVSTTTHGFLVA